MSLIERNARDLAAVAPMPAKGRTLEARPVAVEKEEAELDHALLYFKVEKV